MMSDIIIKFLFLTEIIYESYFNRGFLYFVCNFHIFLMFQIKPINSQPFLKAKASKGMHQVWFKKSPDHHLFIHPRWI